MIRSDRPRARVSGTSASPAPPFGRNWSPAGRWSRTPVRARRARSRTPTRFATPVPQACAPGPRSPSATRRSCAGSLLARWLPPSWRPCSCTGAAHRPPPAASPRRGRAGARLLGGQQPAPTRPLRIRPAGTGTGRAGTAPGQDGCGVRRVALMPTIHQLATHDLLAAFLRAADPTSGRGLLAGCPSGRRPTCSTATCGPMPWRRRDRCRPGHAVHRARPGHRDGGRRGGQDRPLPEGLPPPIGGPGERWDRGRVSPALRLNPTPVEGIGAPSACGMDRFSGRTPQRSTWRALAGARRRPAQDRRSAVKFGCGGFRDAAWPALPAGP